MEDWLPPLLRALDEGLRQLYGPFIARLSLEGDSVLAAQPIDIESWRTPGEAKANLSFAVAAFTLVDPWGARLSWPRRRGSERAP